MVGENFDWKTIDETINYFDEKIKQNKLIGKKHKKVCTALNLNFLLNTYLH